MINQNHLVLLFFGKGEDTWEEGIILGHNAAGHSFVSRDLIPMNVIK